MQKNEIFINFVSFYNNVMCKATSRALLDLKNVMPLNNVYSYEKS